MEPGDAFKAELLSVLVLLHIELGLRIAGSATATLVLGSMERWMDGRTFMAITELQTQNALLSRGHSHFAREHSKNTMPQNLSLPKNVLNQYAYNCPWLTIQTFGWLSLNNECVRKTQRNLPCRIRTNAPFRTTIWGEKTLKKKFFEDTSSQKSSPQNG